MGGQAKDLATRLRHREREQAPARWKGLTEKLIALGREQVVEEEGVFAALLSRVDIVEDGRGALGGEANGLIIFVKNWRPSGIMRAKEPSWLVVIWRWGWVAVPRDGTECYLKPTDFSPINCRWGYVIRKMNSLFISGVIGKLLVGPCFPDPLSNGI